ACDKFIYIEILKSGNRPQKAAAKKARPKKAAKSKAPEVEPEKIEVEPERIETEPERPSPEPIEKVDHDLVKLIEDSISDLADEEGWTFLGDLGNLILKRQPDFDPRNYGFKKL